MTLALGGPGIPLEHHERIFQPCVQLVATRPDRPGLATVDGPLFWFELPKVTSSADDLDPRRHRNPTSRGWIMMNRDNDAAAWTPEHWRSCLATTAEQLSVLANAAIEVGDFWITTFPDSTSLIARIRGFGALPGLACDFWEGSLAIAKGLDGVSADLEAFRLRRVAA